MIFTIGYSNRPLSEFMCELNRRGITQLIDVRSKPWSRNAAFNADQIERWAPRAGIFYRRGGEVLGGHATISLDDPRYIEELNRLVEASSREPLAIMCAEGDPALCHRTWDIGASLLVRHGVVARNILRDGREEEITDTLRRVVSGRINASLSDTISELCGGLRRPKRFGQPTMPKLL